MINKLTKRQKEYIVIHRDNFISSLLDGKNVSDEKMREGVCWLYEFCNFEKPTVLIFDSLFEAEIAVNLIDEQINGQINEQIKRQIDGQINRQIYGQINEQIRGQIDRQIDEQIYEQIDGQINEQIDEQINGQIDGQINEQIYEQIDGQINRQIYEQINGQINRQKLKYFFCSLNELCWNQWYIYLDYFIKTDLIKISDELKNNFEKYLDNVCWWNAIYFEKCVFLIRKPEKIMLNKQSRFHNEHGPAYKAGISSLYFLNGVNFSEELYKKVISREMPMEDILKIEDIDQRTQAMKFAKNGIREFYKSQNGKCIDFYEKQIFGIDKKIKYELWKIPQGNIFNKEVYFAVYDCPSSASHGEQREYAKGVSEFKIVAEAMAWGMSDDIHILSPEEWKGLIPLVHES